MARRSESGRRSEKSLMDLQDLLLLTIHRQGASPDREQLKAIFVGSPNPEKALINALSRLRQKGDLQARVVTLTPQGTAKAVSLGQDLSEEDDCEEPAETYD